MKSRGTGAGWRLYGMAVVRILFGLTWAINAYAHSSVHGAGTGSALSAYGVVAVEIAIAAGLIFGVFLELCFVGGCLFTLGLWLTAERFGLAHVLGANAAGGAISYLLLFVCLWLGDSGEVLSLDRRWAQWRQGERRRRYAKLGLR